MRLAGQREICRGMQGGNRTGVLPEHPKIEVHATNALKQKHGGLDRQLLLKRNRCVGPSLGALEQNAGIDNGVRPEPFRCVRRENSYRYPGRLECRERGRILLEGIGHRQNLHLDAGMRFFGEGFQNPVGFDEPEDNHVDGLSGMLDFPDDDFSGKKASSCGLTPGRGHPDTHADDDPQKNDRGQGDPAEGSDIEATLSKGGWRRLDGEDEAAEEGKINICGDEPHKNIDRVGKKSIKINGGAQEGKHQQIPVPRDGLGFDVAGPDPADQQMEQGGKGEDDHPPSHNLKPLDLVGHEGDRQARHSEGHPQDHRKGDPHLGHDELFVPVEYFRILEFGVGVSVPGGRDLF